MPPEKASRGAWNKRSRNNDVSVLTWEDCMTCALGRRFLAPTVFDISTCDKRAEVQLLISRAHGLERCAGVLQSSSSKPSVLVASDSGVSLTWLCTCACVSRQWRNYWRIWGALHEAVHCGRDSWWLPKHLAWSEFSVPYLDCGVPTMFPLVA